MKAIRYQIPAKQMHKLPHLTKIQKEWLAKRLDSSDFSDRMRLHYYLGNILNSEEEIQECFHTVYALFN